MAFDDERILVLNGKFDRSTAEEIVMDLQFLDHKSSDTIYLFIDSYGGDLGAFKILNKTIQKLKSQLYTICIGKAEGVVFEVFLCGSERIMLDGSKLKINFFKSSPVVKNILKAFSINRIRYRYQTAQKALEFGLANKIVKKFEEI